MMDEYLNSRGLTNDGDEQIAEVKKNPSENDWQIIEEGIKLPVQSGRKSKTRESFEKMSLENREKEINGDSFVFNGKLFESVEAIEKVDLVTKNLPIGNCSMQLPFEKCLKNDKLSTENGSFGRNTMLSSPKIKRVRINLTIKNLPPESYPMPLQSEQNMIESNPTTKSLIAGKNTTLLPTAQKLKNINPSMKSSSARSNTMLHSPGKGQKKAIRAPKNLPVGKNTILQPNGHKLERVIMNLSESFYASIRSAKFNEILGYVLCYLPIIVVFFLAFIDVKYFLGIRQDSNIFLNVEKNLGLREFFKQGPQLMKVGEDTNEDVNLHIETLERQQQRILSMVEILSQALKEKNKKTQSPEEFLSKTSISDYVEALSKWKRKMDILKSEQIDINLRYFRYMQPTLEYGKLKHVIPSRDDLSSTQLEVIASYMKTYEHLKEKFDNREKIFLEEFFTMLKDDVSSIWKMFIGAINEPFLNFTISRNYTSRKNDTRPFYALEF